MFFNLLIEFIVPITENPQLFVWRFSYFSKGTQYNRQGFRRIIFSGRSFFDIYNTINQTGGSLQTQFERDKNLLFRSEPKATEALCALEKQIPYIGSEKTDEKLSDTADQLDRHCLSS